MHIVLTAQPAYSHLVPVLLPLGQLLHDAGHEVVVATGAAGVEHVERAGLPALVLPRAVTIGAVTREILADQSQMGEALSRQLGTASMQVSPQLFARAFVGVLGRRFGEDLFEALEERRPDLVVRETTEYGGYLAAERWGVPQATLDIGPMAPYTHPAILQELDTQRRRFGLGPVSDPWQPIGTLRAGLVPEAFYPPHARLAEARYYRAPIDASGTALDATVADLPDDRPLVLATLGSVAPGMLGEHPRLLEVIVEVLGELPVTGVVALGPGHDSERWPGARPANVHLTAFVQQQTLLPACDLFITHAGFNSIREALGTGVPMVALPIFAEQPANAARVAELGLGIHLDIEDATPTTLRSAVLQVLNDPAFRAHARGMQRRALALPPLNQLVQDLAALAGSSARAGQRRGGSEEIASLRE